jgi:hypothetical protein
MTTADGHVVGTTKIVDHGPAAERYNLVLVAEGYRDAELAAFATACDELVDHLFATPPFDELRCAFNVFRVDVASTDSGADDPVACGGSGATAATYFDASYCNGGIRRLMSVAYGTVTNVVTVEVPEWHQVVVVVNSAIHGGAGGGIAITSTSGSWKDIAIHEMGHSAFGLADEYEYWAGCGSDVDRDHHPNVEPAAPNVTVNTDRATLKWGDLVDAATPLPTTANADCSQCDPQASPAPDGTVGAFEGAHYYHCGAYRPEFHCMMRNFDAFCAVCTRQIRQTMAPFRPRLRCPAPVFEGHGAFTCLLLTLVYLLVIVALIPLIWLPPIRCIVRQLLFRTRNCRRGNDDPCIDLRSP